ncbi:MAG: Crp/Fnr family transcriptional regulator [Rhodospirillales bacterium]|nr:Crp/Fnr family transcriptional regulator [Rhodospirillales bacterium]
MKALVGENNFDRYAACRVCGIRDIVLFADLNEADLALIQRPINEKVYQPGDILFSSGQSGETVFTVRKGLVKLVQFMPDGNQRIVRLLRPGALAGIEVLLGGPYENMAVVLQETTVCEIPVSVVRQLERETPRLQGQILARWHQTVRESEQWLSELSTGNAKGRVARLFLYLLHDGDDRCRLFSREDVGAMLGITTETASHTIAQFKRDGVVLENSRNNFQCNLAELREISGY